MGGHARELDDARRTCAACTERVRLGTLVTGITYRNVAHLGKIVATLDVLSGGRAVCGLGLAWFEQEHTAYGWPFPPRAERYALLEDALAAAAAAVGPGPPAVPAGGCSTCPRRCATPGRCRSGSRSSSAAPASGGRCGSWRSYADACNLFGEPRPSRHKVEVLRRHCEDVERDPATSR